MQKTLAIKERILSANDKNANKLRDVYKQHNKYVINLMGSPGSGKTTLLESLSNIGDFRFCVIEGDLETNRDAERLDIKGILARQITTGEACHLEAKMILDILPTLESEERFLQSDYILIENVGNLVCPASYDLGAHVNIVLLSVPEGSDKVLKYPSMFMCADVVLVTKADMKEYFNFDISRVRADLDSLRNGIDILEISMKDTKSIESFRDKITTLAKENYNSRHIFN